jgi:nucleoside-diphosphate-sugar epimerase
VVAGSPARHRAASPVVCSPGPRRLEVARWVARGLRRCPPVPRTLSLCYVEDLVTALLTAGEAKVPSGEIFHVAGEGAFTWEQVGDALGEALGIHPTPLRIPPPILLALATGADAWA